MFDVILPTNNFIDSTMNKFGMREREIVASVRAWIHHQNLYEWCVCVCLLCGGGQTATQQVAGAHQVPMRAQAHIFFHRVYIHIILSKKVYNFIFFFFLLHFFIYRIWYFFVRWVYLLFKKIIICFFVFISNLNMRIIFSSGKVRKRLI